MSKIDLIRDLRALTQAGMQDCKDALVETGWNLQNAQDLIKQKGKNFVVGKKIAAEGLVATTYFGDDRTCGMVEINCVTDFVARSVDFTSFCQDVIGSMCAYWVLGVTWVPNTEIEEKRQKLISTTKENIEIRCWWIEQSLAEYGKVFSYVHQGGKIGVLLNLQAENEDVLSSQAFNKLGEDLSMQVAAMTPLAVSPEHLDLSVVARQTAIFDAQIKELNKPEAAAKKIMEGKMAKWYKEVCLLNQESVLFPKRSCAKVIEEAQKEAGGKITVINLIRCQVGEGIETEQENFVDEVGNMIE